MRSRLLSAPDLAPHGTGLAGLAQVLASCPAVWAPLAVHDPEHRVHLRLTTGPGWEAYLITWPSGHGVEVHDHGDAAGAVAVVAGSLVELVARRTDRRGAERLVRHRLGAGTVRPVPPGRIHDVVNTGRFPATSIHVYGPALETMTFYDDELRPTRTERVFPEPPVLALDEVTAILDEAATPA
jgi:predicted metal-dependent enzyme (double-stranded beta helix superfamily)